MTELTHPKLSFICCKIAGFSLLAARWFIVGDTVGFFVILFMVCMALLRWRTPQLELTIVADVAVCAIFMPVALALPLFSAMSYRRYWAAVALVALYGDLYALGIAALCAVVGFFLSQWEKERMQGLKQRDISAGRYYELERLQNDLYTATAQIERMTAVSERARIAREIHDNAGHEIVAAYMSLQTARVGLDAADPDSLELYDAALDRLEKGANKIREAVHNLAPVTALGVEVLHGICDRFTTAEVDFKVFGDTNHVPVHVWGVLEACLSETLTNASRHARATSINVELDTTPHIVRLSVENEASSHKYTIGHGLRNLRYRAASIGGSLAIDAGTKFQVICVIPLKNK